MKVAEGYLVSLNVRMFDAQGHLLEATEAPIVYLHGAGDIFARIEAALAGQQAGFRASLTLEPEDAFGEFDAQRVHLVEVDRLGPAIEPGTHIEGLPDLANGLTYVVTDVAEGMAVLDGNHPLAGCTLRFDVEIVAVEAGVAQPEASELPDFLRVVSAHDLHEDDRREPH
jgi:FKBP-type peptidyl-prolyl cis-trans isomerase SlyD